MVSPRCSDEMSAGNFFKEVRSTLVELAENKNVRPSSQAVIKSLAKQSPKMKTYIGLSVCAEVFSHCDTVACLLQKADLAKWFSVCCSYPQEPFAKYS